MNCQSSTSTLTELVVEIEDVNFIHSPEELFKGFFFFAFYVIAVYFLSSYTN